MWEILFTTRKPSLGQGNIFSSVCQEFCPQRGSTLAGTPPSRYTPWAGTPPGSSACKRYGQQAGGTHPTGMHSCFLCFYLNRRCLSCLLHVWDGNYQFWTSFANFEIQTRKQSSRMYNARLLTG